MNNVTPLTNTKFVLYSQILWRIRFKM